MTGETRLLRHTTTEDTAYRCCYYKFRIAWQKSDSSLCPGEFVVELSKCQNARPEARYHLLTRHGVICVSTGLYITCFKKVR